MHIHVELKPHTVGFYRQTLVLQMDGHAVHMARFAVHMAPPVERSRLVEQQRTLTTSLNATMRWAVKDKSRLFSSSCRLCLLFSPRLAAVSAEPMIESVTTLEAIKLLSLE